MTALKLNDIKFGNKYQTLIDRVNCVDIEKSDYENHILDCRRKLYTINAANEREYQTREVWPLTNLNNTDNSDVDTLVALGERLRHAANEANELESSIYRSIGNYLFSIERKTISENIKNSFKLKPRIKVKAVVDFIDLYFEINKNTHRSGIKGFLTKRTGTKFYITDNQEFNIEMHGNGYIIRIHDVHNKSLLDRVINNLKHYDVIDNSLRVYRVELSLDFYNAPMPEHLIIALYKSINLDKSINNERIYNYESKGKFQQMPSGFKDAIKQIGDKTIGINQVNSNRYYRIYHKIKDKQQLLPVNQHRIRIEVNLKVDKPVTEIKQIIKNGFGELNFTQLSKTASLNLKEVYNDEVKLFGRKIEPYNCNGNKRASQKGIETCNHSNEVKRLAVKNLLRSFESE